MMKPIFVILILLSIFSCNSRKRELTKLVREWQNKEILFPDSMEMKVFGRDTVCPDIWEAKYKILSYTDTSGCTECNMKLYDWTRLKQKTDSLGLDVSYIFVAWVNIYEELETLQAINKCDIPFFYDRTGKMQQLNRFPERRSFRSFLLDSANRVVLIGNPVDSKAIQELYLEALQE